MVKIKIITGPTASGKSKLAMEWAKQNGGEIVSADSACVYRKLDIGTAKPSQQDRRQVRHHLIDILDPDQNFAVSEWVQLADIAIADITSRGKYPMVVGGTGLYIKALLYQHDFVTPDYGVRQRLQADILTLGNQHMHNLLKNIDPISANKIEQNDTKRLIRALEIYYTAGKTKSSFLRQSTKKRYDSDISLLDIDRDKLYNIIDNRVDCMIASGFVDEVQSLLQYKACQSMQAIGYKELVAHFDGKLSLRQAIDLIKKNSRNYAKRQLTYFRGQLKI